MAKARHTDFSLHQYLSKIQRNEIVRCFKEHKQDELGCLLCEHALKQLQSYLQNHGEFTMDYHRINRDGDHNLHAVKEFKAMKGLLPVAYPDFSKDQWGYSNQIKADAIYVMHVRDKYGQIKQTIPLFIEVDSGVEPEKKEKYRRAAMKMWQYIAAGHLIPNVDFVATLRMETQIVDRELAEWAKMNTEHMTPEKLIVQNYFDITCACAEIFYALAMSVVYRLHSKTGGDKHKQVDMDGIDANFYETLHAKATTKKKQELWDYHFFIGHFEFDTFLFGSDRVLDPKPEPSLSLVQKAFNKPTDLYTQYFNESDDKFEKDFGLSKDKMKPYFKNNTIKFYDHSGDNSFSEKNPRFLDGFWTKQRNWRCHMKYANKIFFASSKGSNASGTVQKVYGHSKIHMHSVSVARADLNQLKLEQLTNVQGMELPQNMYYWKEIVGLLDQYISLTPDNPDDLTKNIEYSFELKTAKIRIPESHRYWTTSQQVNSHFKKHFFKYSGYHLFIEPFTGAMENTLLTLAEDMYNSRNMLEHKNYSKQISALRLELKREDVVLFDNEKPHIEMPKTSCNLAIMCLKTYHGRDSAYSHISHQYDLQPQLEIYLDENFKNEFLKAFCKMTRCNNKLTLLTMVQRYMHDETVHASIQNKILCFPAAVQAEIYDMLEFIYNDATYNLVTPNKEHDAFEKALLTTDDKLLKGILVLVVRNFWFPFIVHIDLGRAMVYEDGDLDYTTGFWKIFNFNMTDNAENDLDSLVKNRNVVLSKHKFKAWSMPSNVNEIRNDAIRYNVYHQQQKNWFFMRLNNSTMHIINSAQSYDEFLTMIKDYESVLKHDYPRQLTTRDYKVQINTFGASFLETIEKRNAQFEWRKTWMQQQFSGWKYWESKSDKNHIALSMQLFLRCADHYNAFEHCFRVLDKFIKSQRNDRDVEDGDVEIFQHFDVDIGASMVTDPTEMVNRYRKLKYSIPFYEMYKAMYISILFAYWWNKVEQEDANLRSLDQIRLEQRWTQCLRRTHTPFQTLASKIFAQFAYKLEGVDGLKQFTSLNVFDFSNPPHLGQWPNLVPHSVQYTLKDVAYNLNNSRVNLLHDKLTSADVNIQKIYFHIKQHASFVAQHYASIVELDAFLLSQHDDLNARRPEISQFLNVVTKDQYYNDLNFKKAQDVYDLHNKYKDATTDEINNENKYHVPSSLPTVQDPTLTRVKTFYSLAQHDLLHCDFQLFVRNAFGSPAKVKQYKSNDVLQKYYQTVIFTQKPYKIDKTNPNSFETPKAQINEEYFHKFLFQFDNGVQERLRSKYLFPAPNLDAYKKDAIDIPALCTEIDMEPSMWLLYRIMQTFHLISQPSKTKRTQLQLFLFQKFECLREHYMPYALKMHNITRPSTNNFLYEEYYKDLLFSIRNFESFNKIQNVLEHKNDDEYLEDSELEILWTRRENDKINGVDRIDSDQLAKITGINRNWYNKRIKEDKERVIESAFFNTKQLFARALHMAWSWKWCMLKYIAIREYEIVSRDNPEQNI